MTIISPTAMYNISKGGRALEETVYLDIYFITNFLMDLLCLKISARIMGERGKTSRFITGALIGAFYSVASLAASEKGFVFAALWILTAVLMVKISIPTQNTKELIGAITAFFLSVSLSGGIVEGASNVLKRMSGVVIPYQLLSILLCITGLIAFIPFSHRVKSLSKLQCIKAKLCLLENEYDINCLIDSGNLAKEPISGLEVMIISPKASCASLVKRLTEERILPFYCVEVSTLSGRKLLFGVRPSYIQYKSKKTNKLIICVDNELIPNGEWEAILPAGIF
ncbi:MAG: hypothetical protein E7646_07005 [Ruminococcaceae bacterium]|nr:hypothetical protein [Oscillospiraceae bacterium]